MSVLCILLCFLHLTLFFASFFLLFSLKTLLSFQLLPTGIQISVLDNFPGVLREVTVAPKYFKAHLSICSEIQDLIQKNAIVEIDNFSTLCLSLIFVIPQNSGDLQVILNLKKIF